MCMSCTYDWIKDYLNDNHNVDITLNLNSSFQTLMFEQDVKRAKENRKETFNKYIENLFQTYKQRFIETIAPYERNGKYPRHIKFSIRGPSTFEGVDSKLLKQYFETEDCAKIFDRVKIRFINRPLRNEEDIRFYLTINNSYTDERYGKEFILLYLLVEFLEQVA